VKEDSLNTEEGEGEEQKTEDKLIVFYISGLDYQIAIKNYKSINLYKRFDMFRLNTY
jgi:hypothetical protein